MVGGVRHKQYPLTLAVAGDRPCLSRSRTVPRDYVQLENRHRQPVRLPTGVCTAFCLLRVEMRALLLRRFQECTPVALVGSQISE